MSSSKSSSLLFLTLLSFFTISCAVAAEEEKARLIEWPNGEILEMNQKEIDHRLKEENHTGWGIGYMDITDAPFVFERIIDTTQIPTSLSQQAIVNPLLPKATADHLTAIVSKLENYFTRVYNSETGKEAAEWIHAEMTKHAQGRDDIEVKFFPHDFLQPSVIATMKGTSGSDKVVVIGGHEDSVARGGRAPGADDDGTGTAIVMEVFRILATSGYKPKHSIHFQTFAAEEAGLRGSAQIASSYAGNKVNVVAMLNCEMSGYVGNSRTIVMIDDQFTNKAVTNFIKVCADGYSSIPSKTDRCGYACSDHASYHRQNYPAGCIAEGGPSSGANPHMHTPNDLLQYLDMTYTVEFVKTALGFVVEVANFQ